MERPLRREGGTPRGLLLSNGWVRRARNAAALGVLATGWVLAGCHEKGSRAEQRAPPEKAELVEVPIAREPLPKKEPPRLDGKQNEEPPREAAEAPEDAQDAGGGWETLSPGAVLAAEDEFPPEELKVRPRKGSLRIPSADTFSLVRLPEVELSVRLPKGAIIERAVHDPLVTQGPVLYVLFPSGHTEVIRKGAVDFAGEKEWLSTTKTRAKVVFLYEAPDALVHQAEERPHGQYCATAACTELEGQTFCADSAGVTVKTGGKSTRMTLQECAALVTIVRSLRPLDE
ncbi:MAG TPA: hypothetical protein VE153_15555 [Myxococcus sp.]|nr:hypothetical protein [Myxococcus sp.]